MANTTEIKFGNDLAPKRLLLLRFEVGRRWRRIAVNIAKLLELLKKP
jgi:hypothetical protein